MILCIISIRSGGESARNLSLSLTFLLSSIDSIYISTASFKAVRAFIVIIGTLDYIKNIISHDEKDGTINKKRVGYRNMTMHLSI